jgi:hypothetical protein
MLLGYIQKPEVFNDLMHFLDFMPVCVVHKFTGL